jgi:hypothetical protein
MRKALIAAFALLGACAGVGLAASPGVDQACVNRFRAYDNAVTTFANADWGRSPTIPSATSRAIQRLRAGDCLTTWDDLAIMPTVELELRGAMKREHGAPIKPQTLLVGVVDGYAAELQARQFFAGIGYRVRSQGAPFLGRRIYIGPFATAGGLAEAKAVAVRAGFVAPYEKFF